MLVGALDEIIIRSFLPNDSSVIRARSYDFISTAATYRLSRIRLRIRTSLSYSDKLHTKAQSSYYRLILRSGRLRSYPHIPPLGDITDIALHP